MRGRLAMGATFPRAASLSDVQPPQGAVGNGVALTLEGGGFSAFAVQAAMTAALLSECGKATGSAKPTLRATGLFQRFGTVSSNSGGTWFLTSLAYSGEFLSLVEDMAASPDAAGLAFGKRWIGRVLDQLAQVGVVFQDLAAAVKGLFGERGVHFILELGVVTKLGWNYNRVVDLILESTAGIRSDVILESEVREWARGKVWLACQSLVAPTGGDAATLWQSSSGLDAIFFELDCAGFMPTYIPTKISWRLGSKDAVSPAPYVVGTALSPSARVRWTGVDPKQESFYSCCCGTRGVAESSRPFGSFSHFTSGAGQLPLTRVATCSSAVAGCVPTNGLLSKLNTVLRGNFAVWASMAAGGNAFAEAEVLVSAVRGATQPCRASVQQLASAGVHAIADGGYTDNTGIAHAVATGAVEVTAFTIGFDNLIGLFLGSRTCWNCLGSPVPFFPIFADSQEGVLAEIAKFHEVRPLPGARFLNGIRFGRLQVTTADCPWFGIGAGRRVTINIVGVETPLGVGFCEDFNNYAHLVQEIVDAVGSVSPSGSDTIRRALLPFFLGDGKE